MKNWDKDDRYLTDLFRPPESSETNTSVISRLFIEFKFRECKWKQAIHGVVYIDKTVRIQIVKVYKTTMISGSNGKTSRSVVGTNHYAFLFFSRLIVCSLVYFFYFLYYSWKSSIIRHGVMPTTKTAGGPCDLSRTRKIVLLPRPSPR